jgi:6-phosphogluconate dehydrogenase
MQLGMIGLGRMGANMVRRLMRGGHTCVVFDVNPENVKALEAEGAAGAYTLEEFAQKLSAPRAAWVMVPAGEATEKTVGTLGELFQPGDAIIDGGNSYFKDDVRRAKLLAARGIHYVDAGTSGGVWGLERGYCLMIGGPKEAFDRLEPLFRTLAPGSGNVARTATREAATTAEQGYLHCGPSGAGHFVKMIHNGIEYGMMQAYAEGFDLLKRADVPDIAPEYRYKFDMAEIAEVWRYGSVITSWLLDLTSLALARDGELAQFSGVVNDSGEGRWTIIQAIESATPADVLSASLTTRFRSRQDHTYAEKILSAMRFGFGGHVEPPKKG